MLDENERGGEVGGERRSAAGVVVLADLFFAAKIRAVAAALGRPVVLIRDPAELCRALGAGEARTAIIDLELRVGGAAAAIGEVKADPALRDTRVIAFSSHTNEAALAAGRAAGADRVLARSALASQLPALLQ